MRLFCGKKNEEENREDAKARRRGGRRFGGRDLGTPARGVGWVGEKVMGAR